MSNICTNETLMAVASAAYVAVLGANGLRSVALDNIRRAKRLAARIDKVKGFQAPAFAGAHFNEFVVRSKVPYSKVARALLKAGLHGGLPLEGRFPELVESAVFATTEVHTDEDYDRLVTVLEKMS